MDPPHRACDHEPFEPGQVREVDGRGSCGTGTSSYGCSREFKIFTNINSTIVDPKAFDAGSFVDFIGNVPIFPQIALARTVEYFRIPRNVLTICLGKSTSPLGIIVNVNAVRTRVGGLRDARVLEHDAAPGEDLRQRGVAQVIFFESDKVETSYKDRVAASAALQDLRSMRVACRAEVRGPTCRSVGPSAVNAGVQRVARRADVNVPARRCKRWCGPHRRILGLALIRFDAVLRCQSGPDCLALCAPASGLTEEAG